MAVLGRPGAFTHGEDRMRQYRIINDRFFGSYAARRGDPGLQRWARLLQFPRLRARCRLVPDADSQDQCLHPSHGQFDLHIRWLGRKIRALPAQPAHIQSGTLCRNLSPPYSFFVMLSLRTIRLVLPSTPARLIAFASIVFSPASSTQRKSGSEFFQSAPLMRTRNF